MNKLRNVLLIGLVLLLGVGVVPASARQNTWEGFWDGMQTALIVLGTNPTQTYFDTLYDANFPSRDQLFQQLTAEANALSDMEVTYSIFISEDNRAAYQRVVMGVFSQPYIFGNTTLPPTNAPLRYMTQGMMDANGDGKISADFSVTDGFAKFQEFGAIPLAPGQAYGESGFDPALVEFYRAEGQFGLPFAVFPNCVYYNADLFDEAGLNFPPQALDAPDVDEGSVVLWDDDRLNEMSMLLTVDANGNDATMPEFDPENIVQFGFGRLWFTELPELTLNAAVHQGGWLAGYFTFTTQPGTEICVDIFQETLTPPDGMQIPAFAFLHINEDNQIDLAFLNFDVLGITNRLRINPTTIDFAPVDFTEEESGAAGPTATYTATATATSAPSPTPSPTASATATTAPTATPTPAS